MSRIIVLLFGFLSTIISCNDLGSERFYHFTGEAQGTTYSIKVMTNNPSKMKDGIDSIFKSIDRIFSTYIPDSEISGINKSDFLKIQITPWMEYIFKQSFVINKETKGFFDPTIGPFIEYWKNNDSINSSALDSIKQFVGMDKIRVIDGFLYKNDKRMQFDFNAIVPGFTSDIIGDYFYKNGFVNYLVEIGGEVTARGRNQNNKVWTIGIDKPDTSSLINNNRDLMNTISLDNESLATSGNYRKFKTTGKGDILGHIVNPFNGSSDLTDIASITIVSQDCIVADAYATAFISMGFEKSKDFLMHKDNMRAYFIVSDSLGNLIEWESHKGLVNRQLEE
jgi:thiamine biosynthesis lipoprotein